MRKAVFRGIGSYLPSRVVTNDDLSRTVDTTDEWIVRRTGIRCRHILGKDEKVADMAVAASTEALNDAGIAGSDVDIVIVATSTPDKTMPSCATEVQGCIGAINAAAFDINAACSGFVYAVSIADGYIRSKQASVALVVGADAMSRIVDWKDRSTCVLFGDGAGACVLMACDEPERGVISTIIRSDGSLGGILYTTGGVSSTQTSGHICMSGPVLFEHAVTKLVSCIKELLDRNNVTVDDIDCFIPHQANVRIVDLVARKLGLPQEKVVVTIENHANTSAASIPLAMQDAKRKGALREGQLALLAAVGAGFTWGATLVRM